MAEFNGDGESRMRETLQQMQATIQGMVVLMHEQMKWNQSLLGIIRESRGEIQDLLELQKEHRIDIMALFESRKKSPEAEVIGQMSSLTAAIRDLIGRIPPENLR